MKKIIQQYRYYGQNHDNTSIDFKVENGDKKLVTGNIFSQNIDAIISLGIQAYPGLKFYLNGSDEPIIVGATGIFEIDIRDNCEITLLRFDQESINKINDNSNNANYLIIDLIAVKE